MPDHRSSLSSHNALEQAGVDGVALVAFDGHCLLKGAAHDPDIAALDGHLALERAAVDVGSIVEAPAAAQRHAAVEGASLDGRRPALELHLIVVEGTIVERHLASIYKEAAGGAIFGIAAGLVVSIQGKDGVGRGVIIGSGISLLIFAVHTLPQIQNVVVRAVGVLACAGSLQRIRELVVAGDRLIREPSGFRSFFAWKTPGTVVVSGVFPCPLPPACAKTAHDLCAVSAKL